MNRILLVLFCGLTTTSAFSAPELKGSPQELRGFLYPTDKVVTISAEAEEKAYSDKAVVSLVVTTENELLSLAISGNSSLREKVSRLLVKAGVNQDDIKSSKFSSSPEYGWFGSKPSSYKVVNRMAVSILQEEQLKEIAAVADKHEEVELSNIAFEHTKKDEYNAKVKAKALKKVIKQKKFYEKSLGLKLSPIGIRDSNIRQRATRGASVLKDVVVSARRAKESYSSIAKYREPVQDSSFDEIKYEANLSVDFKIK